MRFLRRSWWRSLSPEAQATLIKGAISLIGFGAYVGLIVYVAKKEGRGLNLQDLVRIAEHIPTGDGNFNFKPDEDLTRRFLAAATAPVYPGSVINGEVVEVEVVSTYPPLDVIPSEIVKLEIEPDPAIDEWRQKALEAGALVEESDPPPASMKYREEWRRNAKAPLDGTIYEL